MTTLKPCPICRRLIQWQSWEEHVQKCNKKEKTEIKQDKQIKKDGYDEKVEKL